MLSVIFIITVILTKEVVMATEEYTQYTINHPFYPGESCEDIYNMNPESQDKYIIGSLIISLKFIVG